MAEKIYIVEGRSFRTEADRNLAQKDKAVIDRLREKLPSLSKEEIIDLKQKILSHKINFHTVLGQDFVDELDQELNAKKGSSRKREYKRAEESENVQASVSLQKKERASSAPKVNDARIEEEAKKYLRAKEKQRRIIMILCGLVGLFCLGYFAVYSYYDYRTSLSVEVLSKIKEQGAADSAVKDPSDKPQSVTIHYTEENTELPPVLPEYEALLNVNKKLIGWVKIDDTLIDYPVMQTSDNSYYLDHNMKQEYDKNGTIFLDTNCDVVKPSTNLILYGHHMKSGRMFGQLSKYEDPSFWEDHKMIRFDTIYEYGTYEVMYVFRSRVYDENDVVFKYYQFYDVNSQMEFDSNMEEMAKISLYDTGVTAVYTDHLLTLSTCDYQETNGRFVVVAKKVE